MDNDNDSNIYDLINLTYDNKQYIEGFECSICKKKLFIENYILIFIIYII